MPPQARKRNRRGEGSKLRNEILAAATALLERDGTYDAVTLRAVARCAGISAPSIYGHFPDRAAIFCALAQTSLADLATTLRDAASDSADPVEGLQNIASAYLNFADRRPNSYRLLFDARATQVTASQRADPRAEIVGVLVRAVQACLDCGRSTCADSFAAACVIWMSLHGCAELRASMPHFPWPGKTHELHGVLYGLAGIVPPVSVDSTPP